MVLRRLSPFAHLTFSGAFCSISGISNIFKDKKSKDLDDLDGPGTEKKKGGLSAFRNRKAAPSAAATARASAELDRQAAIAASGLTPAARLARQHTIKSKAAEDAEEERRRSTIGDVTEDGRRPSLDVPSAWESSTATAQTHGRQPVQLVDDGFSDSENEDDGRSLDVDDVADRLAGAELDGHNGDESGEYADWGSYPVTTPPVAPRSILKRTSFVALFSTHAVADWIYLPRSCRAFVVRSRRRAGASSGCVDAHAGQLVRSVDQRDRARNQHTQ